MKSELPYKVYSCQDIELRHRLQSLFEVDVYDSISNDILISQRQVISYSLNPKYIKIVFNNIEFEEIKEFDDNIGNDKSFPHLENLRSLITDHSPIVFDDLKTKFKDRIIKVVVKTFDEYGVKLQEEVHDNLVCEMVECRHDFADNIQFDEIRILLSEREEILNND